MSLHRRNPRRDANEKEIADALESIGIVVLPLSAPGYPDLLCWSSRDGFRLLEVKRPKGKLTGPQLVMQTRVPFSIVRSVHEALAIYGVRT